MVFDDFSDRDATLPNPNIGQGAYIADVSQLYFYDPEQGGWFVFVGEAGPAGADGAPGPPGPDSFWEYDGSTLQPDPATTTPRDHFVVATDADFSLTADDGTTTYAINVPGSSDLVAKVNNDADPTVFSESVLTAGDVSSSWEVDAQAGDFIASIQGAANDSTHDSQITAQAETDTRTARVFLDADDDGANVAISITADDGVTNTSVSVGQTLIAHGGKLGTDQAASASGPVGTVVKKIPIYDNSATLLGYVPVYDAIT